MSEPTRIDELVSLILPRSRLPKHIRPSLLLDGDVEPPSMLAERVEALRELVRRGGRDQPLTGRIVSSRDVAKHFMPRLSPDTLESLWVVGLDAKNRARVERQVARGGPASCLVAPGDILRVLVLNACPAGIIVHNHPSGDPNPSPEDIALTTRCVAGAELLGITFLDHIIVAGEQYFSFLDAGLLQAKKR